VSKGRVFLSRLGGLIHGRRLDQDLRQEIASHLEEAAEEYVRQGLSLTEARRAALRNFGGVAQAEEAYREHLSFRWLDHWRRDLRHAARALHRRAGSSLIVVIVLATGVGAITSVFALLNRIVLQPLPFAQSDRLVVIEHAAPGVNLDRVGISSGLYFYYSRHARSLESLAVYSENVLNLTVPGAGTERVHVTYAGVALFQVLRPKPALGRLFTAEDGRPGFMNMTWTVPVLLAHDFWVDHFGADPNVVGRILTINNNPRRIVGVLPDEFAFPDRHTQVWMLVEPPRESADFARRFGYNAVARMRPGVTAAAAQAELARLVSQIAGVYADATPQRIAEVRLAPVVTPLKSAVIRDVAQVIWTLFGGMALLLLIACANVAGLFLVRAEDRRREIAVRQALGATSRHVARLFFTEALVLTTAAAGLGLLLAKSLLSVVIALVPAELPRTAEIRLDGVAIMFAAGLAVLMAAFYGALAVRRQGRSLTAAS
jgi:predicted permease